MAALMTEPRCFSSLGGSAMRLILVVFLALGVLLSPRPGRAADEVAGTLPPALAHADSVARAISGTWISDADTGRVIQITHAGISTVQVWGGGRFAATGFIDGDAFFGIARVPGLKIAPTGPPRRKVLTFRVLPGLRIEAEFADDLQHRGARVEHWTLSAPGSRPPDASAVPIPTDSLPAFGEFVYVDSLPELVTQVPPDYPMWAREQGVSGTVEVMALIGRDGTVKDTRITHSIPQLDDYARGAVKQWRFKPALSEGKPIAVWVAIPVKFTLH